MERDENAHEAQKLGFLRPFRFLVVKSFPSFADHAEDESVIGNDIPNLPFYPVVHPSVSQIE